MKKTLRTMVGSGLVLVLLLGLIAAGLLYASSLEPKIVFIGEDSNAYIAGIDGKNPKKITSNGMASHPRWLDADTVAVLVEDSIWLVRVTGEGKSASRLTKFSRVVSFSCSPDGKWILFNHSLEGEDETGGEAKLCRIDRNGSNFQVLRFDYYHCPVIAAPNMIFYITAPDLAASRGFEIWMLDLKTKKDRCIYKSKPSTWIGNLVSSKGGQRIIFGGLSKDPNTEYGWDRFYVKEINTRDFQARTLIELSLDGADLNFCSLMPSEEQILLTCLQTCKRPEMCSGLYVLDLKPGAKPKLLIRDAFDADVWY